MSLPKRMAAAKARTELSSILRAFAEITEPADSIGDRAVRIGVYNRDAAVLIPMTDFEAALETEDLLDDLLLEQTVAERLARGPGKLMPFDDLVRELGLEDELKRA
jgi:hypothetical protein